MMNGFAPKRYILGAVTGCC